MNETIQKLKIAEPEIYNALKVLVDRLTPENLDQEVAKAVAPKMKVKELSKIIFSGQKVKIAHQGEVVFRGYANELAYCYFKDSPLNTISSAYSDHVISILIDEVVKPEE